MANIKRPVVKIFPNGEEFEYPSVKEASHCNNVATASIRACINGEQTNCVGCKWKYKGEKLIILKEKPAREKRLPKILDENEMLAIEYFIDKKGPQHNEIKRVFGLSTSRVNAVITYACNEWKQRNKSINLLAKVEGAGIENELN